MLLTEDALLARWRLRAMLEPVHGAGCTLAVDPAMEWVPLDDYGRELLRSWYAELLRTAPTEMLVVSDLRSYVSVAADGSSAEPLTLMLDDDVMRVEELRMDGWTRSVKPLVITEETFPQAPRPWHNPFLRGDATEPVAVMRGNRIEVWTTAISPFPMVIRGVRRPAAGTYELDESALEKLPPPPTS